MDAERDSRDVFVGGVGTVDQVAGVLRDAVGLRGDQVFVVGDPQEISLAALARGDVATVHPLDPRGDFPFEVDMQFARRIDVARFPDVARRRRVRIAYAVDEAAQDLHHVVATEAGVSVRTLSFNDADDDTDICDSV